MGTPMRTSPAPTAIWTSPATTDPPALDTVAVSVVSYENVVPKGGKGAPYVCVVLVWVPAVFVVLVRAVVELLQVGCRYEELCELACSEVRGAAP